VAPTPPAFKPKNIVIEKSDKSILMSLNVLEEEQADALIVAGLNSIQKIKDSTNTDLEAVKTIGRATVAKLKDAVKDLKVGEA
jgi:DNA integrity scanning protein DisA with diadenylate cyclase activity